MTKQYGILAYPAKHSLSPVMHNAAFKALGIDAEYRIYEIPDYELASFMENVKVEPISGLSVSLPYKEVIVNFLNRVDEDAKKIGAVNTVVNSGGALSGYNTDYSGATEALKETYGSLEGKKVVIIGAGGSARAVVYGLLREGASVWIKNRTRQKADMLAVEFAELFNAEIHSCDWNDLISGNILIHSTSLWHERPEEIPSFCDLDYVNHFDVVMEVAYAPLITPLLKAAEKLGKKTISGDKMLLHQAVGQFKLWTGQEAPVEVMREALNTALGIDS
ncbi:shikimate dehydrogenase [Candidatus Peregrinibacteria bacterium]|nr:shikimate dehydrogenase [Candidatus Peregrinibacteria bacterium]